MSYLNFYIYLIFYLLLSSCAENKSHNIDLKGNTMGTYYLISLVDSSKNYNERKITIRD